jgi:pimeloyl-ACP methyl ester carboxylesterase
MPMAAADIETHCHGSGPLVYLIGGGPAFTTWNLQPIQQRLGEHYRVCRWDMRGVGDNAELAFNPQHSALAQWLGDMAEVLPPQPVVLWGHSWGALQVLLFAKHHLEPVSSLVLSNPVDPGLRSLAHIERKRFNHPDLGAGLQPEDMGTPAEDLCNLRSKVASYFADARQGWAYAAGFSGKDTNSALNIRVWNDYRKTPLDATDVRQLADRISGVIYCRDDVLQPESLNAYRRLLSADKHHVLSGCAHFPWEENPQGYYRVLLRLLGGD